MFKGQIWCWSWGQMKTKLVTKLTQFAMYQCNNIVSPGLDWITPFLVSLALQYQPWVQLCSLSLRPVQIFHVDFRLGSLAFDFIHCNIALQKNTASPFFSQSSIHCVKNVILYRHFRSNSLLSTHADQPHHLSPWQHQWMPLGMKI